MENNAEQIREMKKVSEVTAMVIDTWGIYADLASRLARDYKKVYYHVPNESEAPMPQRSYIGHGYGDIELVHEIFGDHMDEANLVLFPGGGLASLQVELSGPRFSKAVWGARYAQDLELKREDCKTFFKKVGIEVGPFKNVRNLEELRHYLKYNEEVFVKVSKWRGLMETFQSINYDSSEVIVDLLATRLGVLQHEIPYTVENKLDNKKEIGNDFYTVDGQFPALLSGGIEIKDEGYVTKIQKYSDFPKPLRDVNDKLAPFLKKCGARCTLATEMRVGKDHIAYPIDLTIREPSPPGELLQEMYTNIAEIQWQGANGILVDPEPIAKFGVQINITSDQVNHKEAQAVQFPEKFRNNVKLHSACKRNGTYYIMPNEFEVNEIGAVVGWGNSIEEAAEMVKEVAGSVKGCSLKIPVQSIVENAKEELDEAAKMGLEMM